MTIDKDFDDLCKRGVVNLLDSDWSNEGSGEKDRTLSGSDLKLDGELLKKFKKHWSENRSQIRTRFSLAGSEAKLEGELLAEFK